MRSTALRKDDVFKFIGSDIHTGEYIFEEIYMGNTLVQHPWGKQHGCLTFAGTPKVKLIRKKHEK